ncbi:MAG: 3'(2'),5'-bisphosphate nucleotidase CysQ [Rhodothermales bacterium]
MEDIIGRIHQGLKEAGDILSAYEPGDVAFRFKQGDDPITEADQRVDAALKRLLPGDEEGWLSEETADSSDRLGCRDVWIVDPLDGTREFVSGIPEWCVSIGFVREGIPVAGGIFNPSTGEKVVGAVGLGVTYNGAPTSASRLTELAGARIAASRSEIKRGEWERFSDAPFAVVPCGSVAYKLGLVAAGRCDATWTLVPKHEWDVAAGVALVLAAGGRVFTVDGSSVSFNRPRPKLSGLIATGPALAEPVADFLEIELPVA